MHKTRAHLSSTNGVYLAINLNCVFIFILSVAFHISPFAVRHSDGNRKRRQYFYSQLAQ